MKDVFLVVLLVLVVVIFLNTTTNGRPGRKWGS
jgi:hypothetical protein